MNNKVNFDAQRQKKLAAIRVQVAKEAAEKLKADELAAKEAMKAQNEVSDAKID
jgi:hypothetical protein